MCTERALGRGAQWIGGLQIGAMGRWRCALAVAFVALYLCLICAVCDLDYFPGQLCHGCNVSDPHVRAFQHGLTR
jgi:hypothetical protein